MKSAYPSNYLLLMPKNKTSFTFVVGAEQKKSQREKKKPMASSGPQEANGHPGAGKRMWVVGGGTCHIDGDAVRMSLVWFLCPALNFCKKPQPTIAQFKNVLFLLRVACFQFRLGSVPALLLLPAAVACSAARLPGRVPDKLCERSVICTQTHTDTHTHFDRCSSCNFV